MQIKIVSQEKVSDTIMTEQVKYVIIMNTRSPLLKVSPCGTVLEK